MAEVGSEYTCSACGGVFERMLSDEDALAESREVFGDLPQEDLAIVCDGCWRAMGLGGTPLADIAAELGLGEEKSEHQAQCGVCGKGMPTAELLTHHCGESGT